MVSPAFTAAMPAQAERALYLLSHGVYVAEVGRKAIFLDLKADKYQAVDRATYRSLAPYLAGSTELDNSTPTERQQKLLDSLTQRRLLTSDPQAGRPVRQITHETPQRHLLPDRNSARLLQRIALLAGLFYTAIRSDRMLRKLPLHACIEHVRGAKAACGKAPPLGSWLPYFLHARFYYPADLICLRDSFMLMNFLLAHGIAADWVFGVQADPFSAHCWVQIGDLAINDDVERTSRFTPILVV
jgi:hypothetical protein